jgi:hypothetical protein
LDFLDSGIGNDINAMFSQSFLDLLLRLLALIVKRYRLRGKQIDLDLLSEIV